ncbi:MAG: 16S rRNA (cytosine(1402)-N(4))-methyltransferase RsmH [Lachnospiraceae bacterium]|nr:16S rRNA (cytosine(1402)-N(4))-methyltransferase RsmH [Lachnospiraceae bacterium]
MDFKHKSVLLSESIEELRIKPDGVYVDGTLGGGGHSLEICKRLTRGGRLIGIDQDADAIAAATRRLEEFRDRVTIVRGNYRDMRAIIRELGVSSVDGVILDLGVSSYQLDTVERGFTYREDAPLDMRMDQRQTLTAMDVVNEYSEMELYRVIRDYGEEKFAKNIARHIVIARSEKKLETTGELIHVIKAAIPMKVRAVGGHPAKRTFQAIRIEVNRELEVLEDSLEDMADLLNDGGRICVITFHSLEDRIVKTKFRYLENPCTCPKEFPVCVCGKQSRGTVITRKPILPSPEELEANSRAKSAKLRVFEGRGEQWQEKDTTGRLPGIVRRVPADREADPTRI